MCLWFQSGAKWISSIHSRVLVRVYASPDLLSGLLRARFFIKTSDQTCADIFLNGVPSTIKVSLQEELECHHPLSIPSEINHCQSTLL